jgi:aspartate ammonia-lyase
MDALDALQEAFFAKARSSTGAQDGPHAPAGRGADVARPGVPRLGHDDRRGSAAHRRVRQFLHEINLGATAIGTTVTAAPGYPELATEYLSELTGRSSSSPAT